jgi:hypothetical protein
MPAEWPEKALLPGYHEHGFVSSWAGNYQTSPVSGPLFDEMWVR